MVSLQYELEGTASGEGDSDSCNSQEAASASGLLRSGACQHKQHLLNGALMHNDGYRLYYHSGRPYLVVQVRGVFALSSAVPCESVVSRFALHLACRTSIKRDSLQLESSWRQQFSVVA